MFIFSIINIFNPFFLNSHTFLLDFISLGNLFRNGDPLKCTELVPYYADLAGGNKSNRFFLRLYE